MTRGVVLRMSPRTTILGGLAILAVASPASADRHEATIGPRPVATLARTTADLGSGGASITDTAPGGGFALSLSYGVHNHVDVGIELARATLAESTYDPATVRVASADVVTGRANGSMWRQPNGSGRGRPIGSHWGRPTGSRVAVG